MHNIQFNKGVIDAGKCINIGKTVAGENYGLFLGVALITWLILIMVGFIPLLSIFIMPILTGPLFVGLYSVYRKKLDGESPDFAVMFSGFNKFVPAMIVSLIIAIPTIIFQVIQFFLGFANALLQAIGTSTSPEGVRSAILGIVLAIVGVSLLVMIATLIIRLFLFFAYMLIDEYNLNAADAIKLSFRAASANIGGLIFLIILQILLSIAGILLCFIGIFFIFPVIYASDVVAYRQVFSQNPNKTMQHTPPPPTEYEDMFSQDKVRI